MAIEKFKIHAVGFNGINVKNHKTQPPINDPKGVPYDLDDPEFPVVKDHEFKVKYWTMLKTPERNGICW
jgi:hypothetical protein